MFTRADLEKRLPRATVTLPTLEASVTVRGLTAAEQIGLYTDLGEDSREIPYRLIEACTLNGDGGPCFESGAADMLTLADFQALWPVVQQLNGGDIGDLEGN